MIFLILKQISKDFILTMVVVIHCVLFFDFALYLNSICLYLDILRELCTFRGGVIEHQNIRMLHFYMITLMKKIGGRQNQIFHFVTKYCLM
jgi:hypothetical protein